MFILIRTSRDAAASELMDELSRIKEAYKKRDESGKSKLYSFFSPSYVVVTQQRERAVLDMLSKYGIADLSVKKVLDVGCGNGGILRECIRYGALPENLYGIDLLPERIESARKLSPHSIEFRHGNAEKLPYDNYAFDIVLCFTVFTSILDTHMKRNLAKEMLRVLKPDGIILWYDYHMNNPKNPDVRGVKKKEIYELFPNCSIGLNRITLAPPIARLIAPYSLLACYILERLKIFNTHYMGVIKRKAT
ncbi:MAG: methyltransferase domain-containing protein [Nitrospirae bacterium]|nr:methyltransferase domain-containing protein [Nitrospirota bacterium]